MTCQLSGKYSGFHLKYSLELNVFLIKMYFKKKVNVTQVLIIPKSTLNLRVIEFTYEIFRSNSWYLAWMSLVKLLFNLAFLVVKAIEVNQGVFVITFLFFCFFSFSYYYRTCNVFSFSISLSVGYKNRIKSTVEAKK